MTPNLGRLGTSGIAAYPAVLTASYALGSLFALLHHMWFSAAVLTCGIALHALVTRLNRSLGHPHGPTPPAPKATDD